MANTTDNPVDIEGAKHKTDGVTDQNPADNIWRYSLNAETDTHQGHQERIAADQQNDAQNQGRQGGDHSGHYSSSGRFRICRIG